MFDQEIIETTSLGSTGEHSISKQLPGDFIERLIPVSIVTGFLGSGKTTLISRILRDPAFAQTAVVVNEFGEIGIDHELIASSDDSILTLNTGCLCCASQSDLAQTLLQLLDRRNAGSATYKRVLIETSGLADPAPMLQTMITDSSIANTHRFPVVVTIVDSMHGELTLREHAEARSQVALADRLLISKTDVQEPSTGLLAELDDLNPGAPRVVVSRVDPLSMFQGSSSAVVPRPLAGARGIRRHGTNTSFTVVREKPLPALALTLLLQGIAEHCGFRLLRLKGIVAIEEVPDRPAVIHGVRHVVTQPEFLDHWPNADKRTRIVFIVNHVPRHFVSRLLDAIEEEVRTASHSLADKLGVELHTSPAQR